MYAVAPLSSIQSQMEFKFLHLDNIFKEIFVFLKRGLASFHTGNSVAPQGYIQGNLPQQEGNLNLSEQANIKLAMLSLPSSAVTFLICGIR